MSHLRTSRQVVVVGCMLIASGILAWLTVPGTSCRPVDAGFWFEKVSFTSSRLGGPITPREMETIESIARSEIARAFDRWPVTLSDRREATHRVRVVQELRDMRHRFEVSIPAESRAVSGVGGQGAVSFTWLASSAVGFAPDDADRGVMIEAIGRGIGRAAVHEFVHLLFPRASIHDSTDVESYEYYSAARREQYFGDLHWDVARPLLEQRSARCGDALKP